MRAILHVVSCKKELDAERNLHERVDESQPSWPKRLAILALEITLVCHVNPSVFLFNPSVSAMSTFHCLFSAVQEQFHAKSSYIKPQCLYTNLNIFFFQYQPVKSWIPNSHVFAQFFQENTLQLSVPTR
jgi:hypothetical protein